MQALVPVGQFPPQRAPLTGAFPAGHVVGVRMLWAPALCRIEAVTLVVYRSEMGKGRWWNLGSGAEAGSQEASPAAAQMQPLDPERGQT